MKPFVPKENGDDQSSPLTVLVVGGNGGLASHYRAVVEERGFALRHYETKVPAGSRRSFGKVALVVIMVTMISHSLRDQARDMAGGAPIVYLRSPSVSALRAAVSGAASTS
jgi:hypothetical protein